MQGLDLLTSFIEVGIGIAGFSSIVVALSRTVITDAVKLAFLQLWIQSGAVILFSSLPLFLDGVLPNEETTFGVASTAYGAYLICIFLFTPVRRRMRTNPVLLIGASFPVVLLINAVVLREAWPYLAVILGGILIAFLSFYQLIKLTWEAEEEA